MTSSTHHRDLSGQRFGKLLAESYVGRAIWVCVCDCGRRAKKTSTALIKGNAISCGCLWKENKKKAATKHGKTKSPTYVIWKEMRARCEKPNNKSYAAYGAKGVRVCSRWQEFSNFLADMGECPPGYSIDRSNPLGNYEPNNCEWIPRSEQGKTSRRAVHVREKTPDILRLRAAGWSQAAIAAEVAVSTGTVSTVLARHSSAPAGPVAGVH